MPVADLSVIGKKTEPVVFEYTWKDVALFALGAGAPHDELHFVYENTPGGIKVLPSFCMVAAREAFPDLGDQIEWSFFLHGDRRSGSSDPFRRKERLSRPVR